MEENIVLEKEVVFVTGGVAALLGDCGQVERELERLRNGFVYNQGNIKENEELRGNGSQSKGTLI